MSVRLSPLDFTPAVPTAQPPSLPPGSRGHRSPHPPKVGPDRIQGYPREHRFIHERSAARHARIYRRKAQRCIGSCSDQMQQHPLYGVGRCN
ncbi:Like-Sm ribonucleoprotein (LSM) domain [Penicillium camemberti]|uniref:Like-Sm ribonucleoprotein (LSM) domain n=1 Tax=Penicillium camemberti (strain FM 013) TaxID=1429867 RepID=A0A0G4P5K2_PENC3|nr:Like-Sm ribonucleoprotein (LSM) domain [Penicillium camemberti]